MTRKYTDKAVRPVIVVKGASTPVSPAGKMSRDTSNTFTEHVPHLAEAQDRTFTLTAWEIGDLVFCRGQNLGGKFQRHVKSQTTDHYYLYMPLPPQDLLQSRAEAARENSADVTPGTVSLHSLNHPMVHETATSDVIIVYIPRQRFGGIAGQMDGFVDGEIAAAGSALSAYLGMIDRILPILTMSASHHMATALVNLVSRVVGEKIAQGSFARFSNLALKQRAYQFIEDNLSNPALGPDHIARQMGLSRAALYRLFDLEAGVSATIEDHRVKAAVRLIQDGRKELSIAEIAKHVGYKNVTSFSRAFSRRMGITACTLKKKYDDETEVSESFGPKDTSHQ
ncbi:helix-turn-helix domain-containing protein [Asticcacaulis excentricus]|uniref:helix-turn-helix domain-containing protein n=1 Tax=Asticcacaulis excentricus TaxID=78587 RepID=UPI000F818EA3|nr:AraC family transcriptional regulator [Asticcacaulis excentricus]